MLCFKFQSSSLNRDKDVRTVGSFLKFSALRLYLVRSTVSYDKDVISLTLFRRRLDMRKS